MSRIAASLVMFGCAMTVAAHVPSRDISMPMAEVQDVFFGYVVGVLVADATLDVDGDTLVSMFPEFADGGAQVPFDEMLRITRDPRPKGAELTIELKGRLNYPVPVDILGYHPGVVLSSPRLVFDEQDYRAADPGFGFVRLEWLRVGDLSIDFAAWLDALLGHLVDDVDARVLAVVEYDETWYVLLGGDTPDGGWITGVYNLASSRIIVRPPAALRQLGENLSHTGPRLSRFPGDWVN